MAKQKGILPIEGTIGNITFYRSGDGYLIREKGGISGDRIANDPRFQRTRENGSEFGRAGNNGKLIRTAFRTLLQNVSDARMVARLTQVLMAVIKSDGTNARGERTIQDGNLSLLKGFDFNGSGPLGTTLFAPFNTGIQRAQGECTIVFPPFVPQTMIAAPAGATHFKLVCAAAAIDFVNQEYDNGMATIPERPLDNVATPTINLLVTLPANSSHPIFLLLGIEFYQMVNNDLYSLRNGAYNALSIVDLQA